MAGQANFARSAKMFVSTVGGAAKAGHTDSNTFEVTPLSGYSLSQSVGTETINLSESGCDSCRSSQVFNTALDPAQVAFSTYLQPFWDNTLSVHDCIERILWNSLVANNLVADITLGSIAPENPTGHAIKSDATQMHIDFENSNTAQLLPLYIFFVFDGNAYEVQDTQTESAEFDFSIDNIAQMNWTMSGSLIQEVDRDLIIDEVTPANGWVAGTDYKELPLNAEYINNKLSTMTVTAATSMPASVRDKVYTVNLTGGSVSVNNNVSYLVPEELSKVSVPAFGTTGARAITGSVSAYLKANAATDVGTVADPFQTAKLLSDMLDNRSLVTNDFEVIIDIGGCNSKIPHVLITVPNATLVFPTIDSGDIIGTTVGFSGKSSGDCKGDEMTVDYISSKLQADGTKAIVAPAGGAAPKP